MESNAQFSLRNGRVTRLHRTPKVTFVTLYVGTGKYEQYIDFCAFDGVADMVGEGESISVKGDVQLAKKKEGERFRTIQLIARVIKPGDESLTPGVPERREKTTEPNVPQGSDDDIPF